MKIRKQNENGVLLIIPHIKSEVQPSKDSGENKF